MCQSGYRDIMAKLGEVKVQAMRLFGQSQPLHALRLYDSIVSAAPLDYEARLKIADCLVALGEADGAIEVYRAVGWYALKSGHPLLSIVVARVLETLSAEKDDLLAASRRAAGDCQQHEAENRSRCGIHRNLASNGKGLNRPK